MAEQGERLQPSNGAPRRPRLARDDEDRPFRTDLEKLYRIDCCTPTPPLRTRLRLWTTHFGLHAVAVYRATRWARAVGARRPWTAPILCTAALAGELALELVHHVRIRADIGPGFYIGHAGSIVIGPTRIGRNFSVTHNVTIGVGHTDGKAGVPVLGDDVWVGTGSVLSGPIDIGDGVTVSNGTMLSRSVPARCLVGGNPGRLVLQDYDNSVLLGVHRAG
jgi:serine O-acetyltransferase